MERVKIMYDNDGAILDYLADLNNRKVIKDLQDLINDSDGKPGCLLCNCPPDNMVVLILYNSPFGFNHGNNKLILYAYDNIRGLSKYFKKMLDNTSPNSADIYKALDDITRLLYLGGLNEQDNSPKSNVLR